MIGLEILLELGAQEMHIIGDSQLVLCVSTPFQSDPIGGSKLNLEALAEFIYQTYFIYPNRVQVTS